MGVFSPWSETPGEDKTWSERNRAQGVETDEQERNTKEKYSWRNILHDNFVQDFNLAAKPEFLSCRKLSKAQAMSDRG